MAPNHEEGGGSGRRALSGGKATRGPERVPLLGGASLVHGETIGFAEAPNSMAVTPRSGRSTAFTGAGRSLMEKEAARGLIDEAEESVDEVRCCGQEQNLYSALARLPAIHTVGVLSLWFVFGRTFLLLEHPDLAVLIVTFFMLYGIFRFWLMWGSAFAAMHSIRKSDSREKNYWQSKPRPPGPDFYSVWHAVMVPNYKEPIEKLRQTLDTLADQTIAHQVVVVMAMESRDPKAVETAEQLEREYSDRLGGFCYALHPLFDGEVAGKSSNENWAARCIAKHMVTRMRIHPDSIVLTTCDADTFFHPNHFACLTHSFLCEGADDRHHRIYLPVTNFMPNVNSVPGLCSARYTALSIGRMAELGNPLASPFPLAVYSVPLKLASAAKYWDPTVIPEDWHMYFRCVFADKGRVKCTKMMITVGTEAVEGSSYWDTIVECYKQSVRWQWGAIDMGYVIVQSCTRWDVPILKRLQILYTVYDHHCFVVVMCIALMSAPFLYGHIPVMLETPITGAVVMVPLKRLMLWSWIVHATAHCCFMTYAESELRNNLLKDRMHFDFSGWHMRFPYRQLQLFLFPIADFFLFVIPTIHAHLRMFFSSNFTYIPSAKMGNRCPVPSTVDCCGVQEDRDSTV